MVLSEHRIHGCRIVVVTEGWQWHTVAITAIVRQIPMDCVLDTCSVRIVAVADSIN